MKPRRRLLGRPPDIFGAIFQAPLLDASHRRTFFLSVIGGRVNFCLVVMGLGR